MTGMLLGRKERQILWFVNIESQTREAAYKNGQVVFGHQAHVPLEAIIAKTQRQAIRGGQHHSIGAQVVSIRYQHHRHRRLWGDHDGFHIGSGNEWYIARNGEQRWNAALHTGMYGKRYSLALPTGLRFPEYLGTQGFRYLGNLSVAGHHAHPVQGPGLGTGCERIGQHGARQQTPFMRL
jgi:hypothetical protein